MFVEGTRGMTSLLGHGAQIIPMNLTTNACQKHTTCFCPMLIDIACIETIGGVSSINQNCL